jgi:hypothetical protein
VKGLFLAIQNPIQMNLRKYIFDLLCVRFIKVRFKMDLSLGYSYIVKLTLWVGLR